MTNEEAIRLLKTLKEKHLHNGTYDKALKMGAEALEKQIPQKPYMDNENGIYEQECCPTCNRHLFPNEHHCRCGQAIDWSE